MPRIRDRTHYGLFVECKIVDSNHPVRNYAAEGIQRFIEGDYAWAMPHAMMVAYVKDTGMSVDDVVAFLSKVGSRYAVTEIELSRLSTEPTLRSVHSRSWQYLASPNPPGPIELIHVWLSLN